MINVYCYDKSGFEDQLSEIYYEAILIRNNSVLIKNKKGVERWYGLSKFKFKF